MDTHELLRSFCLDKPDWKLLDWGLAHTGLLLRQVCVVTTLAFVLIHTRMLQWAVLRVDGHWSNRFRLVMLFAGVAIIDDRATGIVVDLNLHDLAKDRPLWIVELDKQEVIIDLRDMVATVAGLVGGIPVGVGVGIMAGLNRWAMGSDVGPVAGAATVLLGFLSGAFRQAWPKSAANPAMALLIGFIATLLQRAVILSMPYFEALLRHSDFGQVRDYACSVSYMIFFPKLLTNTVGCSLFILTMQTGRAQELDKELRQAELNALRAQVEPHFLGNTLAILEVLVETDRDRAATALHRLGRLFKLFRSHAQHLSILVAEEQQCLDLYIEIEKLRKDFEFVCTIQEDLRDCHISAGCLQTLAENALKHGHYGEPFRLAVAVSAVGQSLCIVVEDNGCGITSERLNEIQRAVRDNQTLVSADGSGSAFSRLSQSLQLAFSGKSSLRIDSTEHHGTTITITHPIRRKPWQILS
ncbi:MAG: LytS/YhcK type 5TM receptor domain-containing protein [Candidatus Methylumidiphilus sp.]